MHYRPDVCIRSQILCLLAVVIVLLAGCTGRPWHEMSSLAGDDDEGIGGTGIRHDEGIGGTGIIGVISDFGSIIVNGLRVNLDVQTPVTIDGRRGAIGDLRRGQVVMVEATGPATSLNARGIAVRHEVIGPVTAVGRGRDELTVLDQRVMLAGHVQGLATPVIGEWVAVSGLRAPNGAVYATRIDRRDSGSAITLRGRYDVDDGIAGPVRVAGQSIDGLSADPGLAGREVLLQGRLVDDRSVATQLIPQDEEPFGGRVERLSIAGFLDRPDGQGRLMGLPVAGLDSVPSLGRADFRGLGRPMIIEGRWSKDRRVLDAWRVGSGLDQRPPPGSTKKNDKDKDKDKDKNNNKGRGQGKAGSNKGSSDSPGKSGDKGNNGGQDGSSAGGQDGGKGGKP